MKLEENLRDKLESKIEPDDNKKIIIQDIKLIGQIDGEYIFEVDKEINEIDSNGNERKISQVHYYLGDELLAALISPNEIGYHSSFKNQDINKQEEIKDILDESLDKSNESMSMKALQEKEMEEVLKEDEKNKKENELTEKEVEQIKVNSIQKVDLSKKVDGRETLGSRLDLNEYEDLFVVYSDKVDEITDGAKVNNTTYSLVGITKDGETRLLNDEFEMDASVGNSATRQQSKIRADGTASRDNRDVSVFTRKSNKTSLGCENDKGYVNMFFYQKTKEENENSWNTSRNC